MVASALISQEFKANLRCTEILSLKKKKEKKAVKQIHKNAHSPDFRVEEQCLQTPDTESSTQ